MTPIKNYEQEYCITESGAVFRLPNMTPMAYGTFPNGYPFVRLTKNGKRKNAMIHRLIADAFIPNPNGYKLINHKNGNKADFSIQNLEWCNYVMNVNHAIENGLTDCNRIVVLNTQTGIFYESIKEAAISINMLPNSLVNKLLNRVKNNTSFIYA